MRTLGYACVSCVCGPALPTPPKPAYPGNGCYQRVSSGSGGVARWSRPGWPEKLSCHLRWVADRLGSARGGGQLPSLAVASASGRCLVKCELIAADFAKGGPPGGAGGGRQGPKFSRATLPRLCLDFADFAGFAETLPRRCGLCRLFRLCRLCRLCGLCGLCRLPLPPLRPAGCPRSGNE
mgnify:CR=1 FL=1